MFVTFSVFQPLRLSEVSFEQPLNMEYANVISSVLTLLRSMLSHSLNQSNSSAQSPVKLTSLVAVTLLTFLVGTSLPHLLYLLNSPQMSVSSPVSLS